MATPASPHGAAPSRLTGVRHIVAVGAGKGGVGKSTVAVNLAIALSQSGWKVGLLDGDIYGPSVPIMLGLKGTTPAMQDDRTLLPVPRYGIHAISMGMLVRDTDAIVWRGPMLGKALQQFIEDVAWGELDALIIDLPPGTGDVQLSLTQLVPVRGAVVVTTPQDVAMADVRRAIRMFEMTRIPILGVVENMAFFTCPDNGKDYYVFGEGRTEQACAELGVERLAVFPLDMGVGPAADAGEPIVVAEPGGDQAMRYHALAKQLRAKLDAGEPEADPASRFSDFFGASKARE